jgi:hypothetical protein
MLLLIIFNAVLLLLGVAVARNRVPMKSVSGLLHGLHGTIGISAPTPKQVRGAVLLWIVSVALIVDVLWVMLQYVF